MSISEKVLENQIKLKTDNNMTIVTAPGTLSLFSKDFSISTYKDLELLSSEHADQETEKGTSQRFLQKLSREF